MFCSLFTEQVSSEIGWNICTLKALTILPYDEWSARRFGQLKAQLEQSSEVISDLDLQIASIAMNQNAALVTHNQKHFSRLTNLSGLVLEDWLV